MNRLSFGRNILLLCLFLLVPLALTACVPAAPVAEVATSEEVAADSGEPIQLTFWHHTYTVATDWMREMIAEYEEMNPGVQIELVEYPHGDYEVALLAAISAGDAPDIINLLDYLYPRYYENGLLAAADPAAFGVEDQQGVIDIFEPRALEGMTFDGQVYGVPAEFNTFVLFANKAHFDEIGLDAEDPANWPQTWDDFFALAKQLEQRDENGNITRMGFNWVWGLDLFWYAQQFWSAAEQYGCQVLDDSGMAGINSPECVAMFTDTWYRLIDEEMGGPDLATPNAVYAFQDFMDNRQSMVIGGAWAPAAWRENSPEVYDNYVVMPIPQLNPDDPKTFLHTYALGVSADSQHPAEAWKFLDFLLSKPGEMLEVAGYINGRAGWADTPEAQAMRGIDVFKDSYATGSFVWRSETFSEEAEAIKNAIETFAQDGDVQGALDAAAEEINAVRAQ